MVPDAFRIPICFLRASYTRLALAIGALAAGVALLCAVDLVNRSVLLAFEEVVDSVAGRAALQITAGNVGFFPEEIADVVGEVPGVELAVQTVSATAFLADESGELLTIHGVDVTNEAAVRVYRARDSGGKILRDPLLFLNKPDSVILTKEFAARRALAVDDTIDLQTPAGRQRFTIRGLLEPEGVALVHGGNLAVMDLFAAEEKFTRPRFINRVDVVVERHADVSSVETAIAARLPHGLTVERPVQRKADLHRVMASMHVILRAVALLALGAAFLIAFNRLATMFDERAWQHGVMRAIGVRRRDLWWELSKESLILGAGGVAIGVPLGIGLARLLLPVMATTMALNVKLLVPDARLALGGSSLIPAVSLGLLAAVLAAARPIWRAARLSVLQTVRGQGVEPAGSHGGRQRTILAMVVLGTMTAMAMQSGGAPPAWGLAATAGVFVGLALAARPLVEFAGVPLTHVACRHSVSTFFGAVALTRKTARTALTVATLGVGFGMVIWLWVVAHSFERSVVDVVHGILRADLIVGSAESSSGFAPEPIDDAVLAELEAIPGVTAVVGEQVVDWHYADGPIAINAFDAAYVASGTFGEWRLVGRHAPDLSEGFAAGSTAIVSTSFVVHLNAQVGDMIALDTPSGPLEVRIGGVVATFLSPRGTVLIAREVYKQRWNDSHVIHALVRTSEQQRGKVRAAISRKLGTRYKLSILTAGEFADWSAAQVRRAFAGLYLLAGLILFVVLVGTADTLAAGVLERRRELAVVRAVGVRPAYLRRIVLTEAFLLGVFGLILASVAGFALGVFWVRAMFPHMLGWVLNLHVPYGQLALVGTVSLATCLLAAVAPAIRAARLVPAEALRYE